MEFFIVQILLVLAVIIGGGVWGVRKIVGTSSHSDFYSQFASSKEDGISQLMFVLGFGFLGMTLVSFNRDWGDIVSWKVILGTVSAAALVSAYYMRSVLLLLEGLVGCVVWFGIQISDWSDTYHIASGAVFACICLLACLLYMIGRAHEDNPRYPRFSLVYTVPSLLGIIFTLFTLSSQSGLYAIRSMGQGTSFLGSWQITLSLAVIGIALLSAIAVALSKKTVGITEALTVLVLGGLLTFTGLFPHSSLFYESTGYYYRTSSQLTASGFTWAFVFNLFSFLLLIGVILAGYARKETALVNIGAACLFIFVLLKYFDWFFTFLDKSAFFIGAGVLMFLVGWFMEKGRRYMISSIQKT